MAYTVIQQAEGSDPNSGISTISTAAFGSSVGSGDQIVVFVATGAASSKTITVTRGSDTVTPIGTVLYNGAQGYEIQAFVIGSAAAGTTAVTANFSGAINDPSILAIHCSGLTGTVAGSKYVEQDSPGTGTDGVTSGNTGTLTTQPCAVFGIGFDITQVAATPPTAGTGFTSLPACWAFGGSVAWARPEHKRVTATTALPSTYTAADGGSSFMVATVAIAEAAGGASVTISGNTATFSAGTLSISGSATLTGNTATFSAGTMSPAGTQTVTITGSTATFSEGTLSISGNVTLSGNTATFSQGTVSASNSTVPPSVTAAPQPPLLASKTLGPFGLGGFALNPNVFAFQNASVLLSAQTLSLSQGTFSPSSSGAVTLSGQTASFTQGTLSPSGSGSATLTGQTATFSAGTFSVSTTGSATLSALTGTFSQGGFTASTSGGTASVSISGQTVSFTQGSFFVGGGGQTGFVLSPGGFPVRPDGRVAVVPFSASVGPYTYERGFKLDAFGRLVISG